MRTLHQTPVADLLRPADFDDRAAVDVCVRCGDEEGDDIGERDRLGEVVDPVGQHDHGQQSTSRRISSKENLPAPITIDARNSMVWTPDPRSQPLLLGERAACWERVDEEVRDAAL